MNTIKVIPADENQLLKYQVFLENTKNIVESHLDTNNMELYNKFSPYRQKQIDYKFVSDLEKTSEIYFPKFTKEQLNSVPDVIEVFGTYKVSDYEKALLLLGEEIKLVSENYGVEKSFILSDNKIFLYDDLIGIGDNINSPLSEDKVIFNSKTNIAMEASKTTEENVIIIPATEEQKKQFHKWEEEFEKIDNKERTSNDNVDLSEELDENYEKKFPNFSKEQLDSVPDLIQFEIFNRKETFQLEQNNKESVLLGEIVTLYTKIHIEDKDEIETLIHLQTNKNNEITIFPNIDESDKLTILSKADAIFDKVLTNNNSNTMEKNANDLEVKGLSRPLQVNDPVMVQQGNTHYTGKIESFGEDGTSKIKVFNNREVKELEVSKEDFNSIKPLFILDKDEKMVYTKFTYEEVTKALNSAEDVKTKFEKGNNPIMGLMLGNKSDVIPFEKKIDEKLAPVEGRLEIKRNSNGEPFLTSDIKFKELNLERPIYGKTFDAAQIEKLKTTGELGLVEGFKSKEGKEFNLWVSVDKELNKVVTKRENDVYIGQIFGVNTTDEQKAKLKNGEGVVLPLKNGNEYYFSVSAATKNANGLKSFTADKAKEFGLIPKQEQEKKNTKSKGMKV